MPKNIKLTGYNGGSEGIIEFLLAEANENGTDAEKLAYQADKLYGSTGGVADVKIVDGNGVGWMRGGSKLDPATGSYLAAQGANAFSGDTLIAANNTIKALKAASLWAKLDALYLFGNPDGKNGAATLVNAKQPGITPGIGLATASNGFLYDTTNGYGWVPVSATDMINSNIKAGKGVQAGNDSGFAAIYYRTEGASGITYSIALSSTVCLLARTRDDACRANRSGAPITRRYTGSGVGMFMISRTTEETLFIMRAVGALVEKEEAYDKANISLGGDTFKFCGDGSDPYLGQSCYAALGAGLSVKEAADFAGIMETQYLIPLGLEAL